MKRLIVGDIHDKSMNDKMATLLLFVHESSIINFELRIKSSDQQLKNSGGYKVKLVPTNSSLQLQTKKTAD